VADDDDPVTGRRMLTQSAYADDRHLRSRMAIYRYAEVPADPGWRISPVAWDGTQVVADVGCGNGFDLRQLVPGGRCRYAFGLDLSGGMLCTLEELARTSGRLTLVQADAEPVVTYLDSIREPVLRYLGEPLDFDAVLGLVAARVEEVIRVRGTFRAVNRSGVFVCR
jgi:SAM-dependent methyltransferase